MLLDNENHIPYDLMEYFFITQDLFIVVWNKRITLLQKKDLAVENRPLFLDFINTKADGLFEIITG